MTLIIGCLQAPSRIVPDNDPRYVEQRLVLQSTLPMLSLDTDRGRNFLKVVGLPTLPAGDIQPDQFNALDAHLIKLLSEHEGLHNLTYQTRVHTAATRHEAERQRRQLDYIRMQLVELRTLVEAARRAEQPIHWQTL